MSRNCSTVLLICTVILREFYTHDDNVSKLGDNSPRGKFLIKLHLTVLLRFVLLHHPAILVFRNTLYTIIYLPSFTKIISGVNNSLTDDTVFASNPLMKLKVVLLCYVFFCTILEFFIIVVLLP